MSKSPLLLGAAALLYAAGIPAAAQDSTNTQPNATADASAPQPTEKEAKILLRCKKMTAQQRAQSSKCTDLMKKFDISETEQDPMAKGFGH
jgi:hypothetical protein